MNAKAAALAFGWLAATFPIGLAAQQPAPAAGGLRITVTIIELQGSSQTSRQYTLALLPGGNQGQSDSVRIGGRVPVRGTDKDGKESITYENIGLSLSCRNASRSNGADATPPDFVDLALSFDDSSLAPGSSPGLPIFRSADSSVTARVALNKPQQKVAEIASLDSDVRYQLLVAAATN